MMTPFFKIIVAWLGFAFALNAGSAVFRRCRRMVSATVLVLVVGFVYAYCRTQLVPYHADSERRGFLLTGDEPDYLLTAFSLARDGDIDVANNIRNSDFLMFQSRPVGGGDFDFFNRISKGRIEARRAQWGESRYMQHRPGISMCIAPVFKLAGGDYRWWAYGLISSCLLAFMVIGFIAASRYGVDCGLAGMVCLGSALAPPVLFYANQVYPEALAGCLLAGAALACMAGGRSAWLAVPALAGVIWFSDRTLPAFFVLALMTVWRLPSAAHRMAAGVILAVDMLLFSQYCQHRFGVPFPISHNEVFDCSLVLVPRRMLQILFDGMQGWVWLFPPVLLVPALAWTLIRQRPVPVVPLVVLAALLLVLAMVASFGDWRGGTNPRGRYYVIPQLLLLPLWFHWLRESGSGVARLRVVWFVLLMAAALIPLPWLAGHPSWWYRPYHPFFGWEPIQRYYDWIPSLPDEAGRREWLKLLAWMPLLLVPSVSCVRAEIKRADS